ncbi:MAG TPA: acetyl-CoA carboxylase, carboxyltransferase subunit beta [Chloroflexota bacterium]|nr:acetyl-CoA carboxylase, carboxyltransferase subunit beta [Chloroflexota bacterium]
MRRLFWRPSRGASGTQEAPPAPESEKPIPDDMWVRCPRCREMIYAREWDGNFKVCQKCGHHATLPAPERVQLLLDEGTFEELDAEMRSGDPLDFRPEGRESYVQKLERTARDSGRPEACIYGRGRLDGIPVVLAVLDMSYFAGTMGSVVGEKIVRACELAAAERRPLVVCSASGGARQQEGVIALLQMAKTAAAVRALGRSCVPYISILTDPTLAGVTASFAALGDCIIAEPGAVVGFAGPRIIEQATGERLPPDADTAEFQLKHGMVDLVVLRRELKETVARVLRLYLDATRHQAESAPAARGAEARVNGRNGRQELPTPVGAGAS